MNTNTETVRNTAKIEPRKWYEIMLGYGGCETRAFAAVEKTGEKEGGYMTMFGPNAMKTRPMCDVWRMIDANGYEMTANDNDLMANGSIGIGSLVPCPYDLPDLTEERLAELVEIGKRNAEQAKRDAEEKARAREEARKTAAREYSYLPNRKGDGKYLRTAQVAQNLRAELKHRFPGVKFSVTSKTFSGGDSINVRYEDGPAHDTIAPIVNKYQDSHADAESGDYWDYDPSAFNDVFGGAKYTWCERSMSAATRAVLFAGITDDRAGWDEQARINRIFQDTALPVGATVTGIEGDTITFTAPEATPAPVKKSRRNIDMAVEISENPDKNGVEIRFATIPPAEVREALKAHGWRWSRFVGCWYTRATEEARTFAREIAAKVAA